MVGILPEFSSSLILSRPGTGMVEEYQDVTWAEGLPYWFVVEATGIYGVWCHISRERCTSYTRCSTRYTSYTRPWERYARYTRYTK